MKFVRQAKEAEKRVASMVASGSATAASVAWAEARDNYNGALGLLNGQPLNKLGASIQSRLDQFIHKYPRGSAISGSNQALGTKKKDAGKENATVTTTKRNVPHPCSLGRAKVRVCVCVCV